MLTKYTNTRGFKMDGQLANGHLNYFMLFEVIHCFFTQVGDYHWTVKTTTSFETGVPGVPAFQIQLALACLFSRSLYQFLYTRANGLCVYGHLTKDTRQVSQKSKCYQVLLILSEEFFLDSI